jgi:hypothetical protein
MDETTLFEQRFEARVRAFAGTGVRPVDSAAVARAVAAGHPRNARTGPAVRWLGLPRDRRAWVIALALGLLVLLLTLSVFVAGGRPPAIPSDPVIPSDPAINPGPAARVIGGLVTPRSGAAAATLADGRVLVLGGRGATEGNRTVLASAEIYDPATGRFTETGSMTEPREQPLATRLHDGRVFVVGGRSSGDAELASAEVYDPATGTFAAVGSMPFARGGCHCGVGFLSMIRPTMTVLADGRVMMVGGRDAQLESAGRADIFDPETGRFTTSAPIPCDVSRGTVTGLPDGTALVTCRAGDGRGSTLAEWQARAFIYDAVSDTFAPTGSPTTDDTGTATLVQDGRVLLTGRGLRTSGAPAEIYDPTTGAFSPVEDEPGLAGHSANPSPYALRVALDTGIVLFLVPDGSRSLVFDPVDERFTPYGPWPGGAAADLGGGRVLLIPGSPDLSVPPSPSVIDLSGLQPTDATSPTPEATP